MEKVDLTKINKNYFSSKTIPEIVELGEYNYLSISGKGDPSSQMFSEDIQAMYLLAYAIKFASKPKDFVVSKLEGLWSFDEKKYSVTISDAPKLIPRSEWEYQLLIMLPDFITKEIVEHQKQLVFAKKGIGKVKSIEFLKLNEGKCVQILHVGPFDTEPESLLKIQEFCLKNNLGKNGLHHEIYLSDFRKTAPEKLKTILREPIKPSYD